MVRRNCTLPEVDAHKGLCYENLGPGIYLDFCLGYLNGYSAGMLFYSIFLTIML